jgi:3'-phosphoadenosine 5'-phosphosulfate sulfotransferase (PAPS reductase)/FAD synthetase
MVERCPDAFVAWSGGKDSTALAHLVRVDCGVPGRVVSIKDDLDFPGEVEYVTRLALRWGLDMKIVSPPFSLQQWLLDHPEVGALDDHWSRGAALSRAGFYPLVDALNANRSGVYLGLRTEESHGRKMNRARRGEIYEQASGQVVCQPLCDWRGLDVFAYLAENGVEPLHVYRCVRFHRDPARVRKSWWLPCSAGRDVSGATWLRTYYPSLHRRLCELMPDARRLA